MTFRRAYVATLGTGALLAALASSAAAETFTVQDQAAPRRPGQVARDGVETLRRVFDEFVTTMPQYALPEINDRGDIVIRRKNPPAHEAPETAPSAADTLEL